MPRELLDAELRELQDEVLILGSMVDKAIDRAVTALKCRDLQASQRIVEDDEEINRKRFAIEESALRLIATQQPMAGDLRTIVTILYLVVDLERMADHAEGIAKISLMIGDEPLLKPLVDIPRMSSRAREMLRAALDAYVARDAEAAQRIAAEDDEVDLLYDQVYRDLVALMVKDPSTIERATYLLWAAHNLERIADRVTNICERVVFAVTGRLTEMNVSKY
ncbi:MAG: phosphate signaling complex protein PhoU [Chloroflexota bacterium]